MTLTLPARALSWNALYSSPHWTKRKRIADEWKYLVLAACRKQKVPKADGQVDIEITAFCKGRVMDSDNVCAKLVIDGLKFAKVIRDDSPEFVRMVTTSAFRAKSDSMIVNVRLTEKAE